MSSSAPSPSETKLDKAEFKQDARDARLSIRKGHEEVLRKQLQSIARDKCAEETRVFAECAKKEKYWVVINCREQCNKMNACLDIYFNDQELAKYIKENSPKKS